MGPHDIVHIILVSVLSAYALPPRVSGMSEGDNSSPRRLDTTGYYGFLREHFPILQYASHPEA